MPYYDIFVKVLYITEYYLPACTDCNLNETTRHSPEEAAATKIKPIAGSGTPAHLLEPEAKRIYSSFETTVHTWMLFLPEPPS